MKDLKKAIIIALVFCTVYLGIVTFFFQGLGKAKYFDDIPDMAIVVAGIVLFLAVYVRREVKARDLLLPGAFLIILERLIEIPMQEYQVLYGPIHPLWWIMNLLIFSTGIFLLLLAVKKLYG